jgi:hypothetical protein
MLDRIADSDLKALSLNEIARLIGCSWLNKDGNSNVHPTARPYLEAMADLENIGDSYGADSGRSVVLYFLSNARSFKGEAAKAIKAELKRRAA